MSLNASLPTIRMSAPRAGMSTHLSPRALAAWDSGLRAAATDDARTIGIYDAIGQDPWTGEGVTAKRIAGALRSIGAGPVTVAVNSPGGDLFEGLAIYNLLREHQGEVTVKVIGVAASAASVISMAADDLQVARAGFLMIHNSLTIAVGNRNDMRAQADWLEQFDAAMADLYAIRTGGKADEIAALMDAETWMSGSDAVKRGFADSLLPSDEPTAHAERANAHAVRMVESALRASGMPRAQAMTLISQIKAEARDSRPPDSEREAADLLAALRSFNL